MRLFPVLLGISFVVGLAFSVYVFYDNPSQAEDSTADLLPSFSAELLLAEGEAQAMITSRELEVPAVINLWASWCTACLYEHPVFVSLQGSGVRIYGINNLDQDEAARRWLEEQGNPYIAVLRDEFGQIGNLLDVYGLPETLLINEDYEIIARQRGIVTQQVWDEKFAPLWQEMQG